MKPSIWDQVLVFLISFVTVLGLSALLSGCSTLVGALGGSRLNEVPPPVGSPTPQGYDGPRSLPGRQEANLSLLNERSPIGELHWHCHFCGIAGNNPDSAQYHADCQGNIEAVADSIKRIAAEKAVDEAWERNR